MDDITGTWIGLKPVGLEKRHDAPQGGPIGSYVGQDVEIGARPWRSAPLLDAVQGHQLTAHQAPRLPYSLA